MRYVPHGDYPKDQRAFNVIKMCPELFKEIDFADFVKVLGLRAHDFFDSETFLFSSQYQSNYGAKLVMLLSSVERVNGRWYSLEDILRSRSFKAKFKAAKTVEEALRILDEEIENYLETFGSLRSVVGFYQKYLDEHQKRVLVNGITLSHVYKKTKLEGGALYTPKHKVSKLIKDLEELDKELADRLKHIIYDIRNSFVHRAIYSPFPDKEYLKKSRLFHYERVKNNEPVDSWVIVIGFEKLHEITLSAFVKYWQEEYRTLKGK